MTRLLKLYKQTYSSMGHYGATSDGDEKVISHHNIKSCLRKSVVTRTFVVKERKKVARGRRSNSQTNHTKPFMPHSAAFVRTKHRLQSRLIQRKEGPSTQATARQLSLFEKAEGGTLHDSPAWSFSLIR